MIKKLISKNHDAKNKIFQFICSTSTKEKKDISGENNQHHENKLMGLIQYVFVYVDLVLSHPSHINIC